MPVLTNYDRFAGRHWETGSVANTLAYQGVKGPHTDRPISEALLLGISGGISFGYYTFDYQGYPPMLNLMGRNSFDPLDTMLDRLGIPREVLQTTSDERAVDNLIEVLEQGRPAIVWADMYLLPYNNKSYDEKMWQVMPLVVFGYDAASDTVSIADRSQRPLTVSTDTLHKARARVKKDRFRLMTLDAPDWDKLPSAVQKGIWQTIGLFTEGPPRGSGKSYGLNGYDHWATMLTNTRNKQSWLRFFPPGERLFAALTDAYSWIMTWGAGQGMERGLYADFLEEAALILEKPALAETAHQFRDCADRWQSLARTLLPENVELLAEARDCIQTSHDLFIEHGDARLDTIKEKNARLDDIRDDVKIMFPIPHDEVMPFFESIQADVQAVADCERQAVEHLQQVMA